MTTHTTCKRCGTEHRTTHRKNGAHQRYCPRCTSNSTKRWRENHREQYNANQRAYYHAHTAEQREAHNTRSREAQRRKTGYYERRGLATPTTTRNVPA